MSDPVYDHAEVTLTHGECNLRITPDTTLADLLRLHDLIDTSHTSVRVSIRDDRLVLWWETEHRCAQAAAGSSAVTPQMLEGLRTAYHRAMKATAYIGDPTIQDAMATIVGALENWDGDVDPPLCPNCRLRIHVGLTGESASGPMYHCDYRDADWGSDA